MLPLFAISNLNQSVLHNLLNYFGGFSSGVFGNNYFFGIAFFLLIIGSLLLLRASLDLIVAIGVPTVLFFTMYGWLPPVVGVITLMGGAGLVTLMIYGMLHR